MSSHWITRRWTSPTTPRFSRRRRCAGRRRDQLRRLQRRRRRGGRSGDRADASMHSPSRRSPSRRRGHGRFSSTTAPTSCSTEKRTARIRRRTPRIRVACMPHRSCSATGSRSPRRARSCFASRACSEGPGRRPSAAAAWAPSSTGYRTRPRCRSSSIASAHRPTRSDIARATAHLLRSGAPHGLYHCVNTGHATWLEIAEDIASVLGKPLHARPLTLAAANLRARRPRYCAMANAKLAAAGHPMPTWQEAVQEFLTANFVTLQTSNF